MFYTTGIIRNADIQPGVSALLIQLRNRNRKLPIYVDVKIQAWVDWKLSPLRMEQQLEIDSNDVHEAEYVLARHIGYEIMISCDGDPDLGIAIFAIDGSGDRKPVAGF